jgi:hypothetical protein
MHKSTGSMASIRSILIGLTINIDTKQLFLNLGLCVKLDLIGLENSSEKTLKPKYPNHNRQ